MSQKYFGKDSTFKASYQKLLEDKRFNLSAKVEAYEGPDGKLHALWSYEPGAHGLKSRSKSSTLRTALKKACPCLVQATMVDSGRYDYLHHCIELLDDLDLLERSSWNETSNFSRISRHHDNLVQWCLHGLKNTKVELLSKINFESVTNRKIEEFKKVIQSPSVQAKLVAKTVKKVYKLKVEDLPTQSLVAEHRAHERKMQKLLSSEYVLLALPGVHKSFHVHGGGAYTAGDYGFVKSGLYRWPEAALLLDSFMDNKRVGLVPWPVAKQINTLIKFSEMLNPSVIPSDSQMEIINSLYDPASGEYSRLSAVYQASLNL